LKYNEDIFSRFNIEKLLGEFKIQAGDTILDPFAGSATTSLI
jgi:DNA modification methylase